MPGSNRGFASMNKEKQREIARKGGKAAHSKGTAHQFTPERTMSRKMLQIVHHQQQKLMQQLMNQTLLDHHRLRRIQMNQSRMDIL
jgi:general stress protein YciG